MTIIRTPHLGAAEIASLLGVSDRTLARWVAAGRFPRPVRYGRRRIWEQDTVTAWIADARKEAQND